METEEILSGLRRYLPADIGAISLEQVEPRFHARLSCTGKTYVYRIWNSELPNVFERHYLYHIQEPLDVAAMRLAAEDLCGTHDFRAFCSLKKFKRSTVRRLEAITIQELGPELRFTFTGDGFLYHMVRILVGTLLAVGRGKNPPGHGGYPGLPGPSPGGETVPACGLCLEAVTIPDNPGRASGRVPFLSVRKGGVAYGHPPHAPQADRDKGGQGPQPEKPGCGHPLHQVVGIAGVSGSGKSSLALGVVYAEGSRRYLEALSTYTRRRMTQAAQAEVESVRYVPAALALHQRPGVRGSAPPSARGRSCSTPCA